MAETKEPSQEEIDTLNKAMSILHKLHHDYGKPCEPAWLLLTLVASLPCEHSTPKCAPCMTKFVQDTTDECKEEIEKNGLKPVRGLSEPLHDGGILESSFKHRSGTLKN